MNAVEFRTKLQEALRPEYLDKLEQYLIDVQEKGSIEDKRKALEFIGKIVEAVPTGAEAQRMFPMVHITFGAAGQVQAVNVNPPLVEEVVPPVPTLTVPKAAVTVPKAAATGPKAILTAEQVGQQIDEALPAVRKPEGAPKKPVPVLSVLDNL